MRTSERFFDMKRRGDKIAMLTAYDAPMARALAEGGADVLLVGDSVGTNLLGYASEREVTMGDMVHHARAVRRGAPDAFVIVDLPYGSVATAPLARANARRLREAGADMVKFEGAHPDIVRALKDDGLLVCCHLGLEPQNHEEKRLKGKTAAEALTLLADARALDACGMDMIVLELMPEPVAETVTRAVKAPTIGIGAGRRTDGQVLVITDVLGYAPTRFKHNKRYAEIGATVRESASAYARDVRAGLFPTETNAFKMPAAEYEAFCAGLSAAPGPAARAPLETAPL